MAKVAFIAHGLTSPLNASLELSRRLEQAGHEVTYFCHRNVGEEVEANGFAFVRLTDQDEVRKGISFNNPVDWVRQMREARSRSIESTELEDAIRSLEPDLLLIDIEMHYPIIATAGLGIPTMLVVNWLSIYRIPELPPLNSDLLPHNDRAIDLAWRKVRFAAIWARLKHKLGKGAIGDLLRPVSYETRFYADLKRVARHRGYSLRDNTDRKQWLRPFMYTRLPVLCLNAIEVEFPHEPHPNIRYVGPMVNESRTEIRVSADDLRRWQEFKETRSGKHRPLVYCSLGSYWSDRDFLRMVLEVFAKRPEWDLVLGLGGQVTAAELGAVPENVLLLGYAPQLEVLRKADCAVNHGGITSINECITYGVPMVVYSPGLLDQHGCAARIEHHNLGVRADWKSRDAAEMERHIEHVLGSRPIQTSIDQMRLEYDAYKRDNVAVQVIEQHLAGHADGT